MRGPGRGCRRAPRGLRDADVPGLFRAAGLPSLTAVQRAAAPCIYHRLDTLVMAPTGSGKTECAVVPAFARMGASGGGRGTRALYVTPLRALNRDILRRVSSHAAREGLSVGVRHGDTPQRERRAMAASPPDVLITTPESLVVLLGQRRALGALAGLEWAVIDEVHELLPSKRGAQLALSLERLALNARREFTRVGLSATVGNPAEAAKFVAGTRGRCRVVRDPSPRRHDVSVEPSPGGPAAAARAVAARAAAEPPGSRVLVFANTRSESELLAAALRAGGTPAELHHGSLSRGAREEAEEALRGGRGGVTVCTSSLELGLDIEAVDLVIHYGSPRQVSKMVQRIGRSRHRGGAAARGLVLAPGPDDELEAEAILRRAAAGSFEEQRPHERPLDVLAHHLVGLAMQLGEVPVGAALEVASRAWPFRGLGGPELAEVLELMAASRLVRLGPGRASFSRGGASLRYHFEGVSTIPDAARYVVVDSVANRAVGSLDQRFVGDHGDRGSVFVLRGSHWRVLAVDERAMAVRVEPARPDGTLVPYWEGERIPVDGETARLVGALRAGGRGRAPAAAAGGAVPDDRTLVAESCRPEGAVVLHACLGTGANAALGAAISSLVSAETGRTVEVRSDAYRIALHSRPPVTERLLRGALAGAGDLEALLAASLEGTRAVGWGVWSAAKKFGIVDRRAPYDRRAARFLWDRYAGTPVAREVLRDIYHSKFDVPGARRALDGLASGRLRLVWAEAGRFSGLAAPVLGHAGGQPHSPAGTERGVLEAVRERLEGTRRRLVCARCGGWEVSMELRAARERRLACPRCGGRQIASTFHADHGLSAVIRKRRAGGRLTAEERRRDERAWKTSSLVASFGGAALFALSGHGVGPDTAARILRDMGDEGEGLLRQVYEAERQYVATRGFWGD